MKFSPGYIASILLVVLLAGCLIYLNFFGLGNLYLNTINKADNIVTKTDESLRSITCPEDITPKKVEMQEFKVFASSIVKRGNNTILNNGEKIRKIRSTWLDGQPIEHINKVGQMYENCAPGSSKGENINHLYCQDLVYNKEVKNISSEGIVGDTYSRKYLVSLELKPLGSLGQVIQSQNIAGVEVETINLSSAIGESSWVQDPNSPGILLLLNYSVVSSHCINET